MKYPRTLHYSFSPGLSKDDRINPEEEHIKSLDTIIHLEKLDGENNCLSKHGIFARSHSLPTESKWTAPLRRRWLYMKEDLAAENIEIFGENLYAIHSIEYLDLPDYFFVFGVRKNDMWLSWEEVKFYVSYFDLFTVPVVSMEPHLNNLTIKSLTDEISIFNSINALTKEKCSMEGIVSRNSKEFSIDVFNQNVIKYVRANHVQTDIHWTKTWRPAKLPINAIYL